MNAYIERVINEVKERSAAMPEFIQTVEEVLTSLEPVIEKHPEGDGQARCRSQQEDDEQHGFSCPGDQAGETEQDKQKQKTAGDRRRGEHHALGQPVLIIGLHFLSAFLRGIRWPC